MTPPEPPTGTVIIDADGDAWQNRHGRWFMADGYAPYCEWAELNAQYGPVRVIWLTGGGS